MEQKKTESAGAKVEPKKTSTAGVKTEPKVELDKYGSPVGGAVDKEGNPVPNATSVRNSENGTVQVDEGGLASKRPVENTPNAKSTARTEAAKEGPAKENAPEGTGSGTGSSTAGLKK